MSYVKKIQIKCHLAPKKLVKKFQNLQEIVLTVTDFKRKIVDVANSLTVSQLKLCKRCITFLSNHLAFWRHFGQVFQGMSF